MIGTKPAKITTQIIGNHQNHVTRRLRLGLLDADNLTNCEDDPKSYFLMHFFKLFLTTFTGIISV